MIERFPTESNHGHSWLYPKLGACFVKMLGEQGFRDGRALGEHSWAHFLRPPAQKLHPICALRKMFFPAPKAMAKSCKFLFLKVNFIDENFSDF